MKSFKVRDGKVKVDGVVYSQSPSDSNIMGKYGRIHSINMGGITFFPSSGVFDDGTIPVVSDSTGIVEDTTPVKKKRASKKATK